MAKTLTAIACRNMRPGKGRREIPDGGCRGLYFIVQSSGVKSWAARFRFQGATRKLTLGTFLDNGIQEPGGDPVIGTPLSLASARELATKALRQAASGIDPCAEKRQHRVDQIGIAEGTLQAIAAKYLKLDGAKLRTVGQRKSDLELICKRLGVKPIGDIRRSMVTDCLDDIAENSGPVRADRCLAALKKLFNWHAERDDYFRTPLGRGGRHTKPKELARTRVLSDDELRKLWLAAETYPGPFGAYLRLTLLTAARRSESAGLRYDELADDGSTWIIPGSRYKSGNDTLIPLSKAAQQIIKSQPVLGPYVFSADGSRPLGGFADRKKDFDKVAGVENYRTHDLRRTSRTLLSRAGIPVDIAERCLGHVMGGVRGTYDRHEYQAEKAEAFEALAAQIQRVVHPPAAKVADLGEARARRRARR
jgi:integrase